MVFHIQGSLHRKLLKDSGTSMATTKLNTLLVYGCMPFNQTKFFVVKYFGFKYGSKENTEHL